MMETIKDARIYLLFVLLIIGYYAYSAINGIAFWESSTVTRNTEYNNNSRTRGVHAFYHK
ncbi:hypothetical protein [Mucilaginibacter psychrotolerans]|uniref:Uncharacterized protein n=1 Tax=Mucilaginibacter psychrotolerans TaxID=1524096 RepID=A0A4Y8SNC3_9SPHI|nr:hypothetical protein [Mucilaginibacter psychrotolerans]TFF40195.1 hypothetical protein E2R66_02785 [Mucilaginibacter psychrotolerans]